jgi:hypothetical protein
MTELKENKIVESLLKSASDKLDINVDELKFDKVSNGFESVLEGMSGDGKLVDMIKPLRKIAVDDELKKELKLGEDFTEKEVEKAVSAAQDLDNFINDTYNENIKASDLISIAGKIDRINLQIAIIDKQNEGIVLNPKDPMYKHVYVSNDKGVLAKDIFIKESLEKSIKDMKDSLYMTHLIENIKKPSTYIDKSRFKATQKKLMNKIFGDKLDGLNANELATFPHLMDFDEMLDILNEINGAEATSVYNITFVYAFMKYVSKYYNVKKSYIDSIHDNIMYIRRYPYLEQNELVIDSLEKVYTKLFM